MKAVTRRQIAKARAKGWSPGGVAGELREYFCIAGCGQSVTRYAQDREGVTPYVCLDCRRSLDHFERHRRRLSKPATLPQDGP